MKTPQCLIIFSVFVVCVSASSLLHLTRAAPPPQNSTLDYLGRALNGLGRAMTFFQRVHEDVNLDAIIGTRMVEASFNILLQRLDASDLINEIPSYVISKIKQLRDIARDVSDRATPYIMESEPDYYANIGPILAEGLFELDYDSRDVSQSAFIWPFNPVEATDEQESDNCLAEVFGTRNGMTCAISNSCWKRMTSVGYNGYSLSHEILYLQIAERFGCQLEMQWQMMTNGQSSLRRLQDLFCGNMLAEANNIADMGFLPAARDLFMEQAALCGMLGFREFFSSEWLDRTLSWQDLNEGCYKWKDWQAPEKKNLKSGHRRVKREEKRLPHGCLCHRTTVASAALAQYVRYILEVWVQEQLQ